MTPARMNKVLKACLITLTLVVVVGVYFVDKKLSNVAQNTAKTKAEIEISQKQTETYELTKIKVDELGYVNDLAKTVLPTSQDQSAVVAEVSAFASRANLSITTLIFPEDTGTKTDAKDKGAKKKKLPAGVAIVPLTIELGESTKYTDLLDFLKYVEQNRRKMQVTELAIKPNSKDSNVLSEVAINMNLFVKAKVSDEK